jgi:hypothetical protein
MNPMLRTGAEFLRFLGCTKLTGREGRFPHLGRLRALSKSRKPVSVRFEYKASWGQHSEASRGAFWDQARYPFPSVRFLDPTPEDGPEPLTHYLTVSGDERRAILTTASVVDAAAKSWLRERVGVDEDHTFTLFRAASVDNWNPKVLFYVKHPEGWVPDPDNVWEQPKPVLDDPDEFLKSLG